MTVKPKDASTVIILRRAIQGRAEGFEVLMALRSSRSAFVPGSYVFPGGRVDDADCGEDLSTFVQGDGRSFIRNVSAGYGDDMRARGIWIAAVRETFEEVGILIASPRNSSRLLSFDSPGSRERFQGYREDLRSNRLSFREMLEREDLVVSLERLHFFSHWITPTFFPLRYDTRFFVTALPTGQEARHDGDEMTNHKWFTPREAIEGYLKNRFHMLVPQIVTLEELCRYKTVNEVIASTRNKLVSSVLTRVVFEGDEIQEHAPDGRIFRYIAR